MTTLLLIRHGETEWNREGRYTGQSDVPLNETGREQARRAGEALRLYRLEAIVASDLERAWETAEIIAAALPGVPLRPEPRLREINQGAWEGMLFPEIKARFAEAFAAREADPLAVAPPGGESVGEVQARVLAAVEEICGRWPNGRVAVVAHGLSLALIRVQAAGRPVTQVWEMVPPNATVEEVELTA